MSNLLWIRSWRDPCECLDYQSCGREIVPSAVIFAVSCRMASKVIGGGVLGLRECVAKALRGNGMIHEDGDNDTIGGNDDERAIIKKKLPDEVGIIGENEEVIVKNIHRGKSILNIGRAWLGEDIVLLNNPVIGFGGLRFLNFFNDPRIIREQRIAAYKGYRGGSGGCFEMKGRLWCKVEAYEGGFGCSGGRGYCGRKRGDVASFETKRRSKLLVTKGAGQIWALHGFQESFQANRISPDSGRIWVDGIRCATQILMLINCLAYELYWNILCRNMNLIATQQVALGNSLVPYEKRLKIERCNARIAFSKPQREERIKSLMDSTQLSPLLSAVHAFDVEITGLDRLMELQAQILWGMYNKKNVDYVALLWEDFMYQADNRENIFVSKTQDYQQYGALIPDDMINQDLKDFKLTRLLRLVPKKWKSSPRKESKEGIRKLAFNLKIIVSCHQSTPGVHISKEGERKPAKADYKVKGVLDEQQRKTSGIDEGTGTNQGSPIERTDSNDDDENPSFTPKDYDEEEHDKECESDDDNENVFEEEDDDVYKDVDSYEQVVEDAHVTLTASQKTKSSKQSSSVSSDFASKFLILENVSPAVDEVASMMNVKKERKLYIDVVEKSIKDIIKDEVKSLLPQILPKEVSDFATHAIQSTINESLENVVLAKSSSQPKSTYEAAESLIEFELKKILLDKMERSESYKTTPKHKELYEGLAKSYKYHNLKIDNLTQEILVGPAFNLLKGTCKSFVELECHFEECYKAFCWTTLNKDLKYLKGGSSSRKYTTSSTKTKAAKYDNIEGIEDMVMELWSPVKVAYDKFAMWGILHWGPKRQKFYGYTSNMESKHEVFYRK
ncbi:hypothetical protein Tco_0747343 [Tanacetum coccineum]|uniref:Uncharacterized protein n=1 Tax=Tanacetum coccineum TaxID=301880 RepID=A0ABQ4YV98_9ASTR